MYSVLLTRLTYLLTSAAAAATTAITGSEAQRTHFEDP